MGVTPTYRTYVLEQLGRVVPVTSRSMFGGVGIYSQGLFFALIYGDLLYLKVDDSNRADFEKLGMEPFRPYGDDGKAMQYYELPGELLDDPTELRPWVEKALTVAQRKSRPG